MRNILFSNNFAILTAENPMHPVSMQGGNQALENELTLKGLKFHKIKGKYGGNPENSYLIENPDHNAIIDLGKKFGQDSVIVSKDGQHKMVYTNGPDTGKHHLGNSIETFENPPEDYYSSGVDNGKPFHFSINFDMDTKHGDEMKKSQPQYLVHFSTTPGLKELDPMMQGSAGRHSPETKHGRPEHPRVYFYEEGTPTESVVTGGAKAKYIVKHPGNDKIYDIAKDPHGLQQQAKEQWLQKPIGSMQDAYFKLLKDKGYMGFKNSSSGLPNVVALFHKTPVHAEVPAPADMSANKNWTEALIPNMKKSDIKQAVKEIKGSAKVNEVLADAPADKRSKILAALRKEKLEKINGTGVPGAGGATPPMMQPPVPAAPAMTGMAKADESESKMAKKDLKDIMEYAQALDGMVVESEDLEDWVDSKIAVARQYLSDIAHYLSYEHGQPTEDLDKGDVIGMKDKKVISTDTQPASKELVAQQPKMPKIKHPPVLIQTVKMAKSDSKKAKFERCVMAVKKKSGDKVNPWAVCHASVDGKMEKADDSEITHRQDRNLAIESGFKLKPLVLNEGRIHAERHIQNRKEAEIHLITKEKDGTYRLDVHSSSPKKEYGDIKSSHKHNSMAEAVQASNNIASRLHPRRPEPTEPAASSASELPKLPKLNLSLNSHANIDGKMEKAEMSVKEQEKPTKGMPQAKQLKADADLEKVKEGAENVAKAADKKKSELNKSTGYFKQNPKTQLPEWHDPLKQQREEAAQEERDVRPEEKAHIWAMLEREHQMAQKPKTQKPKEELEKGKNYKEQQKVVFGNWKTSAGSTKREKQIAALTDMIKRRFGLTAQRAPGKKNKAGKIIDKPNFHDDVVQHIGNPDSLAHEVGHLYQFGKEMKTGKPKEMSLDEWQKDMDEHWGTLNERHGYKKQAQTAEEYEPTALEQYYRRRAGLPPHQKTASTEEQNRIESEKRGKKYKQPLIPRTQAVDNPSKEIIQKVKVKGKDGTEKEVWLTGTSKNIGPETKELVDKIDRGELVLDPKRGFVQGTSPDAKINIRAREASKDKSRKDVDTLMRSEELQKKLIIGEGKPSKATVKATPEEHKAIMDKLSTALDTVKVDQSPKAIKERKMLLEHVKNKLKGYK